MSRLRSALPVLAALGAPLAFMIAMYWPLPLWPYSFFDHAPFAGGHVWAMDHLAGLLTGRIEEDGLTSDIGWPTMRHAQFLAWWPTLVGIPLAAIWGPLGAYNLQILLAPTLAAGACAAWIRRATDADGWTAALAGVLYGLSPYMLGNLGAGNIDKVQLWFYPAWLLAMWTLLHAKRGWLTLPLFPLLGLAMVFTEPYFGLFLPLFAGPLVLGRGLWRRSPRELGLGLVGLVATGAGMAPARTYFDIPEELRAELQMFMPSSIVRPDVPPEFQAPVATIQGLLWRPFAIPEDPTEVLHVSVLGLPLLIGLGLALWGKRTQVKELWAWVALAAMGLVIAMGPQLMVDGQWQTLGETPLYLPMELLDRAQYPLARGGQYYRANPILVLGLVTLLAAALATRAVRFQRWAWVILPLNLVHGVWACGEMFPRPVGKYPGYEVIREMRADSAQPYGVITLPAFGTQAQENDKVAAGPLLDLPVTAHLLQKPFNEHARVPIWGAGIRDRTLRPNEYSYILLFKTFDAGPQPEFLSEASLREQWGEPKWETDEVVVWDLYVRPGSRPKGY